LLAGKPTDGISDHLRGAERDAVWHPNGEPRANYQCEHDPESRWCAFALFWLDGAVSHCENPITRKMAKVFPSYRNTPFIVPIQMFPPFVFQYTKEN